MNRIKLTLSFIIIALVFIFVSYVTYNTAEAKAYDYMIKHITTMKLPFDKHKQVYGSDDIVLVMIDSRTVEKYRWPWKRETNCKLFEYLHNTDAKAVVHDSILATLDYDNIESDRKFFNTISKFDNLVEGFMPVIKNWDNSERGKVYDRRFGEKFSINVTDKSSSSPDLYGSVMTFPKPYFDAVKYAGSVSMLPGFINGNLASWSMDEIYRNHEYIFKYKGKYYPSLAMRTFLLVKNNPEILITNKSINFPELNYKIKHTKNHYQKITPIRFYKLYPTGYSHIRYSAVDLMDSYDNMQTGKKSTIDPAVFKDKIVVIGANVPAGTGLNDNKNTSISVNHPGADIQASVIDNILHNDFMNVLPDWINILLTLIGMIFVYSFIRVFNLLKSIVSVLGVIAVYLLFAAGCFYFKTVVSVLTPVVMFVLTIILAYTHKFVLENRSKEKVKSAMGKYMSEDVMKRVVMDIDNLGLGGKKATVTVLFSDIRGFTSMSEQMSAQQVSEILNEYFTEMEPIISKYNGIINKFIGDAIMAVFGEPIQDKNHAQNAVKCAYEMLEKVKELQKKWAKENKPKIEIGIGINTGEVFVGNIGSVNRMEYTVIGDTVNLASRLESYNKIYKTKLLISPTTYEEVKSFADVIKISDVQIRGKSHKMDIYEVLKVTL